MRALLCLGLVTASAPTALAAPPQIAVTVQEADQRVDVTVDGKPFTAYRWKKDFHKPLLWPLVTDTGTAITRGWPLEPKPNEATDHPHHIGSWLNYGAVAGADFWNSSDELRKKEPHGKFGNIVHTKITAAKGGPGRGELAITADWVLDMERPARVPLRESTRFLFAAAEGRRWFDRVTTLTATEDVPMPDNKEGLFAVRLTSPLEHKSTKNPAGTGQYTSSEGTTGEAVWGTRARWMMLTGTVDGAKVTVAILDHPKNPGHPTYWHARGYGLFAANPLGAAAFTKDREKVGYSLAKGKSARFAYRVLLLSRHATAPELETEWKQFAAAK